MLSPLLGLLNLYCFLVLPALLFPQQAVLILSLVIPSRDISRLSWLHELVGRMQDWDNTGIFKDLQLSILWVLLCHDVK